MRALGEPTGSRRVTDEQHTGRQPERSDGRDSDADADERTSPSPYADDFSEWVADETAPPDGALPQSAPREAGAR